jgi:hypothetical protein
MINLRLQSWAGEALSTVCAVLLFVVMFDHMTAIKYISMGVLIAIVILLAARSLLGSVRKRSSFPSFPSFPPLPLLIALGVWALWTLTSAAWSFDPAATLHAWLDEVAYPLVSFYAFWLVGKESLNQRRLQTVAWGTCLILAVASVVWFNSLDPAAPKPGPLYYYARVGHTSTLALMAIPLFASMTADAKARIGGLTGILFCVVIGGATLNRFFWIALAVVAVVLLWPRSSRDRVRALTALGALLFATLVAVGFSNKLRLTAAAANAESGISTRQLPASTASVVRVLARPTDMQARTENFLPVPRAGGGLSSRLGVASGMNRAMTSDARPRIWKFYGSQVSSHPWFGVGFGKPLPPLAYRNLIPEDLVKLDGNVRTHAHNIFLNTLLQVGIVGLIIQIAVFACLTYQFFTARLAYPQLFRAGIALILGMLAKNLTDDFMWQSTMLMFWSYCGWLLGQSAIRFEKLDTTTPMYQESRHGLSVEPAERELEAVSG